MFPYTNKLFLGKSSLKVLLIHNFPITIFPIFRFNPLKAGHTLQRYGMKYLSYMISVSQSPQSGAYTPTWGQPGSRLKVTSLNPLKAGHTLQQKPRPKQLPLLNYVSIPSKRGIHSNTWCRCSTTFQKSFLVSIPSKRGIHSNYS